jgi:hypothetical protein
MGIFTSDPIAASDVLRCFTRFPYRHLFLSSVKCVLNFVEKEQRYFLLVYVAERTADDPKVYSELLKYIWASIPNKDTMTKEWRFIRTIEAFLQAKGHENTEFLLNSISTSERERLFLYNGQGICYRLVYDNKWDILKKCIKSSIISKDSALKFKKEERISSNLSRCGFSESELKSKIETFHSIIDDLIIFLDHKKENKEPEQAIDKKRNVEEAADVCTNSKNRTCN